MSTSLVSPADAPRALVVGLGISGIATALRLHEIGWRPVIVERAAGRRSGGYFVGLFGVGNSAAKRMGILDGLHNRTSGVGQVEIDRTGRKTPGLAFTDLPGNPWLILRGDVEQAAFAKLPADVEIHYSTSPTAITQDDGGVDVELTTTDVATGAVTVTTDRFDLVVGADGLRSTVRRLAFGPHENYLHRLDHIVAAYELPATPAGLLPGQGATLIEPGRSMWIFPFSDHNPTALLSYRTDDVDAEFTGDRAARIRAVYGPEPLGATLGSVIDAFDPDTALFDSVEQVRMDSWHRGRVVLVGDAAWCVTLYAGMGVSAGLAGADLLATVLADQPGRIDAALNLWEQALRPHIEDYQKTGIDQRAFFTPGNRREICSRRLITTLVRNRVLGPLLERFTTLSPTSKIKDADVGQFAARARHLAAAH